MPACRLAQPSHRRRNTMIDLHMHTTASDGRSTPDVLARRAADVGLSVIAVTDHDTMAAVAATREAAAPLGITVIP